MQNLKVQEEIAVGRKLHCPKKNSKEHLKATNESMGETTIIRESMGYDLGFGIDFCSIFLEF